MKMKLIAGILTACVLLAGCSANNSEPSNQTEATETNTATPTAAEVKIKEATGLDLDLDKLYLNEDQRKYAEEMLGTEAPGFTLTNLSGQIIQLKDYLGQNIVLELGQSSCTACQQTQPEIDEFRKANPDVTVLQVYANDKTTDIEGFLAKTGTEGHPNFLTGDEGNTVFRDYNAKWTPTTLFINKEGVIVFLHIGTATKVHFEQFAKLAF